MGVEGFRSSEGSLMHFKISIGCKSFVAVVAIEGFLSSKGKFFDFFCQEWAFRLVLISCEYVNFLCLSVDCMEKQLKIVFTFKFHPLHLKISTPTGTPVPDEKVKELSFSMGSFMHFQIFTGCKSFFTGHSRKVYLKCGFLHAL